MAGFWDGFGTGTAYYQIAFQSNAPGQADSLKMPTDKSGQLGFRIGMGVAAALNAQANSYDIGGFQGAGAARQTTATAESTANAALAAGKASGAASELVIGNKVYTAVSGESVPENAAMTGALMGTPKASQAQWHGGCAEVGCITKALNDGQNPAGGTIRTVNIGDSGSGHNTPKDPCISCQDIIKHFKVNQ
jgi:hypothetical protein